MLLLRRSWKILRRTGALAAIVICTGSDCCKPTPPPITVPRLGKVEILTTTVYSAPDRLFRWRALVTDPTGRVIAVDAYPEITIKWSSVKAAGLFVNPSGNPVIVQVPSAPGTVIDDITVTVTRTIGSDVTQVGTTVPGTILIAATIPKDDVLRVEYLPEEPPVAVLVDARIGADCPLNDWAIAVVDVADLGKNLEGGCPPAPELAIFAAGREMVFRDQSDPVGWTPNDDVEIEDPLPAPAFRTVSVVVAAPDAATLAWVSQEIDNAHALFEMNRSGIGLETSNTFVHGRASGITDRIEACKTPALDALLLPGGYTIGSPDLFVLFVADIEDTVGGVTYSYQGLTCPVATDQAGRVVFLALDTYLDTTFAHELGHMFGLMKPRIGFGEGHVDASVGDFRQDNLMWNATEYEIRYRRDRFSLGQVFRMNLDIGSWLNNGGLDPGVVRTRDCQTATTAGVCPALDKEPG